MCAAEQTIRTFSALCVALLAIWLLAACGSEEEAQVTPLQIAVLAPFSGTLEPLGQSVRNGAVQAVEEWNQGGGVLGRPVEIIVKDTQCNVESASAAAAEIVDQGITFVVGGVCANASAVISEIAQDNGILQLSPASTTIDLTMDGDGQVRPLVFRTCFTDAAQGVAAAKFAVERLDKETAAILYEQASSYGIGLADAFEETFVDIGAEVMVRESYDLDDPDSLTSILEEVLEARPQMLYLPGYYMAANTLVPQARSQGITATVMGSDGWHGAELDAGAVDGAYFIVHYFNGDPRNRVQAWAREYRNKYITEPDALATLAYDTTNMLLTAINSSDTDDPEAAAEILETMSFDAISGPILFDAFHNPVKPGVILRASDGEIQYVERFTP